MEEADERAKAPTKGILEMRGLIFVLETVIFSRVSKCECRQELQ